MGLQEKIRPVILAGALALSQLSGSGAPMYAEASQRTRPIDIAEGFTPPEQTEAQKVLKAVRPSLYKIEFIPKNASVPKINFCTGWASSPDTLVTAFHCGRHYWKGENLTLTIDAEGKPLYDAIAYQDKNRSTGIWKLDWVPPQNIEPPYEDFVDIGQWKSERPFPKPLAQGDLSTQKAGDMFYVVHYPWNKFEPSVTPGWFVNGDGSKLVMGAGGAGSIISGSSGGVVANKDYAGLGVLNGPLPSSFVDFEYYARGLGITDTRGIGSFLRGTSLQGLADMGF